MPRRPKGVDERHESWNRRMSAPGTLGGTSELASPRQGRRSRGQARPRELGTSQQAGYPTLLIASADAPLSVKQMATAVCDGTDDQNEINDAFAALPADGGRVQLSAGPFQQSGPITPTGNWQRLAGVGPATFLEPHTTGFSRLIHDPNGQSHFQIHDLTCLRSSSDLYDLSLSLIVELVGCWQGVLKEIHIHGAGVRFTDCVASRIRDCELLPATVDRDYEAVMFHGTTDYFDCRFNSIDGGIIEEAGRRAIRFDTVEACSARNVYVRRGSMIDSGTYDAVLFHNDVRYSSLLGCHIDGELFVRYGARENGTENSALGNRLQGSGATADLSWAGTDSLTAANHADGTIK